MKNRKRGFTLIELLVVVLIIGILSAVALPQYQKAVEKSRAVEAQTFISNAQKAVDVYMLENDIPSRTYFTGKHANTTLAIDVTSGMDCTKGDMDCSSKNFRCSIANPYMNVNNEVSIRCTRINGPLHYELEAVYGSNNKWRYACFYDGSSQSSKAFCDSFESLGWSSWEG